MEYCLVQKEPDLLKLKLCMILYNHILNPSPLTSPLVENVRILLTFASLQEAKVRFISVISGPCIWLYTFIPSLVIFRIHPQNASRVFKEKCEKSPGTVDLKSRQTLMGPITFPTKFCWNPFSSSCSALVTRKPKNHHGWHFFGWLIKVKISQISHPRSSEKLLTFPPVVVSDWSVCRDKWHNRLSCFRCDGSHFSKDGSCQGVKVRNGGRFLLDH